MIGNSGLFRRSVFRKHLLLFFATILIPTLLIVTVYWFIASHETKEQITKDSSARLDRIDRNMNMFLDSIDRMALQFSFTPSVSNYLNHSYTMTAFDYYIVKEQMRDWKFSNPLIHSFSMHVFLNDKVLTADEGIYDNEEYFDRAFLNDMREMNIERAASWTGLRTPKDPLMNSESEVVTFVKAIPILQHPPLGLLNIGIDKNRLLDLITPRTDSAGTMELIIDPQNQLLSRAPVQMDYNSLIQNLQSGEQRTHIASLGEERYFVTARKHSGNEWVMLQLTPYQVYSEEMLSTLRTILLVFTVILLLGLAMSYLFASLLYEPWKRLTKRLKDHMIYPPDSAVDDYTIVDSTIGNMISTIRHNEPIVRSTLVRDLLQGQLAGEQEAERRLNELGISFPHPGCLALIIAWEPSKLAAADPQKHSILYLFSLAEDVLDAEFRLIGTVLDRSKIGFILNVEQAERDAALTDKLSECCDRLLSHINGQGLAPLTISAGEVKSLHLIHESCEQAQRTMTYKAFLHHEGVLFPDDTAAPQRFDYPVSYQKLLLNVILTGDRKQAEELMSGLFDRYVFNSRYSESKLQQMITMLMGSIVSSLAQEGYDVGPILGETDFLHFQDSRNSSQLLVDINARIGLIMNHLDSLRQVQPYSSLVSKTIAFMEQNYANNLSIADIAEAMGISNSHLSRVFKSELGKTPLEYLTEYRLEHGKRLLADSTLSLNQISQAIGYNHAHTFIRYFKLYVGMTPGDFRKTQLE
ncbi:AraC family transcriptional regulator [Paenibacillus sp. J5C_2022]|uniref:AraC family transcriptional regulator n=1 Tax=Paenibacillus sp. J5C2022 TaxID=2977129 RepID=UPI0021CDFF39|nr:AraC family transcriptional regulator [Paenibacillus sp. J5C2022]MCU6711867.1 AraC family transcriptional regulator [Paenibacillus sp. J5C2022]